MGDPAILAPTQIADVMKHADAVFDSVVNDEAFPPTGEEMILMMAQLLRTQHQYVHTLRKRLQEVKK